ncbi:MAG: molecular chaperone DnaJ [Cellulosilyticaceae bacterium]
MATTYNEISKLIHSQNYAEAENKLTTLTTQDDKWHYLYSIILFQKSWFDSAKKHLETAITLNPTNKTYEKTLAKFMGRPHTYSDDYYKSPHYRRRSGCCCCCCCCDDDCCHISCCDLICADTCCECMGGDLISCI